MTDSMDSDPPWHLLPHLASQFFGLGPNPTRDALKQAYSVLIRRFKPDKFPQEFKCIRAAYEQVDRQIRFATPGEQSGAMPSPQNLERSIVSNPFLHQEMLQRAPAFSTRFGAQRDLAIVNLSNRDPAAWYSELAERANKSSFEYYLLAVLSDLVDGASKGFGAWIAEGVSMHPTDNDLIELFRKLLSRSEVPAEELGRTLQKMVRSTPSHLYCYLTDSLWRHYVQMVSWSTFEADVDACERTMTSDDNTARVALTVSLMRRAMWRAPIEWLQAKKRWIEDSQVAISGSLEFDHEINCRIMMLRERFMPRLQQGAYGKRILDSIRAFCEEDHGDAANKIIECQQEIADQPKEFLSEFAFQPEELTPWCQGWQWICWMILSKLSTQELPSDQAKVSATIAHGLRHFNRRFPQSILLSVFLRNVAGILLYLLLATAGSLLLIFGASGIWVNLFGVESGVGLILFLVAMLIGVGTSIAYYRRAQVRWKDKFIEPYIRGKVIAQYQKNWRLRVAQSMQFLLCPYSLYLEVIPQLCQGHRNSQLIPSSWLTPLMTHDVGLILYSAAVPFRR